MWYVYCRDYTGAGFLEKRVGLSGAERLRSMQVKQASSNVPGWGSQRSLPHAHLFSR